MVSSTHHVTAAKPERRRDVSGFDVTPIDAPSAAVELVFEVEKPVVTDGGPVVAIELILPAGHSTAVQ